MFGLGVAQGMFTTLKHFFSLNNVVTVQYPEQRIELPPWTRGRPRLIYDLDSGDLRCTACGACALACPVDVIKIEQHPSPVKGKVLDRFDLDMGGCIECALCVEACPFRAIVMAPDFEFGTYDREQSLVFNMHELRIAGTPEVDSAMEYIQGVKRGLAGQAKAGGAAAGGARAGAGAAPPAAGATRAGAAPAPGDRQPVGATAGDPAKAAGAASGPRRPGGATGATTKAPGAVDEVADASGGGDGTPEPAAARPAASTASAAAGGGGSGPLARTDDMAGLSAADRAKIYKERAAAAGLGKAAPKEG